MKKSIGFALAFSALFTLPASAVDDYSGIPSEVRADIKSRCVARYPDDYVLQDGCIGNQSNSYLRVHGDESPGQSDTPSAYTRAQFNNAAYLGVVNAICHLDTGDLMDRYAKRGVDSAPKMSEEAVSALVSEAMARHRAAGSADRSAFCATAKANLPNFVADLNN